MEAGFEVRKDGVRYWAGDWEKLVPFGRDKAHRPGGLAFREAAQEHQRRITEAQKGDGHGHDQVLHQGPVD